MFLLSGERQDMYTPSFDILCEEQGCSVGITSNVKCLELVQHLNKTKKMCYSIQFAVAVLSLFDHQLHYFGSKIFLDISILLFYCSTVLL